MIAITGLAALIVRIFAFTQLVFLPTWAFQRIAEYFIADDSIFPFPTHELIMIGISVLIWIVLFIWAPALCRAFAGPYRDAQIDLGLTGADMFRLAFLIAGVMIVVPATGGLLFYTDTFLLWHLGGLLRLLIGLILIVIGLMPDRFFRAIGALAPSPARRDAAEAADSRGGDTPS